LGSSTASTRTSRLPCLAEAALRMMEIDMRAEIRDARAAI